MAGDFPEPGQVFDNPKADSVPLPVSGHLYAQIDPMLGEYDFTGSKLRDNTGVLYPKFSTKIIPEKWDEPSR